MQKVRVNPAPDVEDLAIARVAELRQGEDRGAYVALRKLPDGNWTVEVVRGDGSTEGWQR